MTTLKAGDRGSRVELLRKALNEDNAVKPPLEESGRFDDLTEDAVKAFQKRHAHLKNTGAADAATQTALGMIVQPKVPPWPESAPVGLLRGALLILKDQRDAAADAHRATGRLKQAQKSALQKIAAQEQQLGAILYAIDRFAADERARHSKVTELKKVFDASREARPDKATKAVASARQIFEERDRHAGSFVARLERLGDILSATDLEVREIGDLSAIVPNALRKPEIRMARRGSRDAAEVRR